MADEFNPKQATDPHEDKWNRLTVSSRANDLKGAVDVNEKLDDYIAFSRHKISSGLSFQDQAFREMNKHEDKLKSFNQRILKDFEDLKRTKNFPSHHYRFPVSNEPLASSFIVNPEQISPLVKASEERIKALEKEMDHRERDTLKMNGIIELLIEENRYLRDHISAKNRDITKILETVGLNDGETTHDLRHRISLLSEENNLLLSHLEELKVVKENFDRFSRDKNNEILRSNAEYDQCRQSLEEALKREEVLTNYKQMMDPKFRQAQEKNAELEATVSDLIEELNQVKNQNVVLSNQAATYRRGLEDAEGKNTLELDRLVQELNMLQNEKKELKKVIEAKDKTIEERQNDLRKTRKDLEQTRLEFEETVQVLSEQKNNLANERQTTEVAIKREREFKERNNALADELEKLQAKMRNLEDEHIRSLENLKFEHSGLEAKLEQKLQKKKRKIREKDELYKTEVGSLKAQLEEVAKILDSVSAEREDYARKYDELARKEHTFAGRERRLQDLEEQVERLKKEVDRYQQELEDTERRYRAQNDDLRAESNKLNDINKDLLEELAGLRKEVEETVKKGPSGNMRNGIYDSTKENTRESVRRRAEGFDRSAESFSPAKRDGGKSLAELENENQYLHQMIKSLVQSNDTQRPNHFAGVGHRGSDPAISPHKSTSADLVRQSYLDKSKAIIGASSLSPMRRQEAGEYAGLSQARRSGDNFAYQKKDDERVRLTPYQMRSSLTGPNPERLSAKTYTDVKNKDNEGVDHVISSILKKYNMEKVPDYAGKNRYGGSYEASRDVGSASGLAGREGGYRSPQMQFLSPLLSTPKYESKAGSMVNSVNRKEEVADRILSPDPTFISRQGR